MFGLAAQADFISYTNIYSPAQTDWTNTVSLHRFSPVLGTLDSIQVTVESGMTTVLSVTNFGNSASDGTAITQLKVYLPSGTYNLFSGSPVLNYISQDFNYSLSAGGGVLSSHRGAGGGFAFARRPENVSVLDVVEALDGPVSVAACTSGHCDQEDQCGPSVVWRDAEAAFEGVLAGTSIADLAERESQQRAGQPMFQI